MWQNGNTNNTYIANAAGSYWVKSKKLCASRLDTFNVISSKASVFLGNDTSICLGDSFLLNVFAPGAMNFLWQDGRTGNSMDIKNGGVYSIAVTDEYGCIGRDSINVTVENPRQDLGNDVVKCNDEPLATMLYATAKEGDNITWSDGSHNMSLPIKDTGLYWVSVIGHCNSSDTVYVYQKMCDCNIEIPTAFTPNNDNHNDVFRSIVQPGLYC